MKTPLKYFLIALLLSLFMGVSLYSQPVKIAFLPFQNMDGNFDLNIHSYQLQDSVMKAFMELDPDGQYYEIVPPEELELLLADMNLDPMNPQYDTDMWKAAEMLGAAKVVTGNFKFKAKYLLINAYVYDVNTKLPDPDHQARDIFKKPKDAMKAVPAIVKKLSKVFIPASN